MATEPIANVALGPEFQIPGIDSTAPAGEAAGGFGTMLQSSLDKLDGALQDASAQSAALATGTTDDLTGVVTSVQRAQLELQLAVQIRNKAVEAYQDLFRMQV
jgi:flagellar hook-basal body complex protein FliE